MNVALVLLALVIVPGNAIAAAPSACDDDRTSGAAIDAPEHTPQILATLNAYRVAHGAPALVLDPGATRVAWMWARYMARSGFGNGSTGWTTDEWSVVVASCTGSPGWAAQWDWQSDPEGFAARQTSEDMYTEKYRNPEFTHIGIATVIDGYPYYAVVFKRAPAAAVFPGVLAPSGSLSLQLGGAAGRVCADPGAESWDRPVLVPRRNVRGLQVSRRPNGCLLVRATGWSSVPLSLPVTAYDMGGNASQRGSIEVTVTPPAAPRAAADTSRVRAGRSVIIPVLANDSAFGGSIQRLIGRPRVGRASVVGKTIRYTAPAGSSGRVRFRYQLIDGAGQTIVGAVTVRIVP